MDQDRAEELLKPYEFQSKKVPGLKVLAFGGVCSISLNDVKFCKINLMSGHIKFEDKEFLPLLNNISPKFRFQVAIQLGELYAIKNLGAKYIDEFKTDFPNNQLSEFSTDEFRLRPFHKKTLDGYSDGFDIEMLDSNAIVEVLCSRNGQDITPSIYVKRLGPDAYYREHDININTKIGNDKAAEEEYGKAVDYLTQVPDSIIGERLSEWAEDVNKTTQILISQLMMTDYDEAIIDVELKDSTETLIIQPVSIDRHNEDIKLSDLQEYSIKGTEGKLKHIIRDNGTNLYGYAVSIVNVLELEKEYDKSVDNLKKFFKDNLYPDVLKLYSPYEYDKLSGKTKEDFRIFKRKYTALFGYTSRAVSDNEILTDIIKNENIDPYFRDFMDNIQESANYLNAVNDGISPKIAMNCLDAESIEAQITKMQLLNDMMLLSDNPPSNWCTKEELDGFANQMLETIYSDSKLVKNLQPGFAEQIDVVFYTSDVPIMDGILMLKDEGIEEACKRACIKQGEDLSNKDVLKYLTVKVYLNYYDRSARVFAVTDTEELRKALNRGIRSPQGEILISKTEQEEIIRYFETSKDVSLEHAVAEELSDITIAPKINNAVVSENSDYVSVDFEVSNEELDDILFLRTNISTLLDITDLDEFFESNYQVKFTAIISKDDISVHVSSPELENDIPLVFKDHEKQILKNYTEQTLGMSVETALAAKKGDRSTGEIKPNKPKKER